MAWCPHCQDDRPITRQTYDGPCSICKKGFTSLGQAIDHKVECRGAVPGAFDVCSHCNELLFAKARTADEHARLAHAEQNMPKSACFVVTATMGNDNGRIVGELRRFRDSILGRFKIGRAFVAWYYQNGPICADLISGSLLRRMFSLALIVLPLYCVAFVANRVVSR